MPPLLKVCKHCKNPIRGRRPHAVYCSVRCRLDEQMERRGRQAKRDGPYDPFCFWCEKPLPRNARRDILYCSARCRTAHHRWNHSSGFRMASRPPPAG